MCFASYCPMALVNVLSLVVISLTTLWTLAGLVAVFRVTRQRVVPMDRPPPVSVLKPLAGADPELEANLASFFEQAHPCFELVFGATDSDDPALAVVRGVAARYPNVDCRVVVHSGIGALNPKVDNLGGLAPLAKHDLLLISDSNVRAPRHYLSELATVFARERPGVVTNLLAGARENSFGGALESVELAGFCAAGVALPISLGDGVLVGKSALFSRSALERLGGLERFSDVLAEDFVLAKTFAHAGQRVVLAPTVLSNVTRGMSLGAALARHLRWSMLRARLRPLASVLEPLTSPLAQLPLAWVALGPAALIWVALVIALRDVGGWLVLCGTRRLWFALLLGALRDLFALGVWCMTPLHRHVSWRGRRYRIGAGTLLYPEQGERPSPS